MQILHSQVIGQGKPLFILHGFLGMADNWRTLGLRFAEKGFEVHLLDARNHGHSFHADGFSYEFMVQDVLDYANSKNILKFSVLGHSMGGKTAMLLAVLHPEKIEKVIIADISPKHYPVHHQLIIDALSSIDFQSITSRSEVDKQLSKSILDIGTRQFLLKSLYWETKEKLAFRFNLPSLRNNLPEIGKGLPEKTVFQGNILFLYGAKSSYIKDGDKQLIIKHFPNAIIEEIPNAGHWLHVDNPTDFMEKALRFL